MGCQALREELQPTYVVAHSKKHLLSEELQPTYVVALSKEASSQRRASAHLRGGACQRKHLLSEELQPTYVVAHVKGSSSLRRASPPTWWRMSKPPSSQRRASATLAHIKEACFSATSATTWWRMSKEALLSEELQPTYVVAHAKEASSQRGASARWR